MNILVMSQMYPSKKKPRLGIFIKREVEAISSYFKVKVLSPRANFFGRKDINLKKSDMDIAYPNYFPLPGKFFSPIKGIWFFLFTFNLIKRITKEFNFDIIHAYRVYPEGVAAILLGKLFKKPVVISARGSDINVSTQNYLIRRQISYAIKRAKKVITVSRALKKRLKDLGVSEERVYVMPKGVGLNQFRVMCKAEAREKLNLPQDRKIILYVGNLVDIKNPSALIKSILYIPEKDRNNYFFVMVGSGNLRSRLEREIDNNNCNSFFHLVGDVDSSQIPLWMNAADVLTLTSFNEGMPNVLYEAFACGLPVIAANVGGVPEVIENGKNGFLIEPNQYELLAQSIVRLTLDKSIREKFSKAGRYYIEKNNLTWQENALKVKDLYHSINKY